MSLKMESNVKGGQGIKNQMHAFCMVPATLILNNRISLIMFMQVSSVWTHLHSFIIIRESIDITMLKAYIF